MTFIVDFDGTITTSDTVNELLERYAPPEWMDVQKLWIDQKITARECMKTQINMVEISQQELDKFIAEIQIDPFFKIFIDQWQSRLGIIIVSDGLDYVIQKVLIQNHLPPLKVYANKLIFNVQSLDIDFPYTQEGCPAGVCKSAIAAKYSSPITLIGDGRSDICLAEKADRVFAKGFLSGYCLEKNITYTPFKTFADVLQKLD